MSKDQAFERFEPSLPPVPWRLRLAIEADVPELENLISLSVQELQAADYTAEQRKAALGPVFGVDRQLIQDGTFWVAEAAGKIVGCGGWSWRRKIYGGEGQGLGGGEALDPLRDAARVRAFFVHPQWARRGIGRCLLSACEEALRQAGFTHAELVGTLTGEALYAACGYFVVAREEAPLRGGLTLAVVRMKKKFG
jgi:N-acetylglutamate synthase-like GNAT family acetyltransferase